MQDEFQIGVIVPSYGHYDYVERCVRSAFENSPPDTHVLMVEDAHPDYERDWSKHFHHFLTDTDDAGNLVTRDRFHETRYSKNGGLIRSLNHGMEFFRDMGARYVVLGNSDLVFAPNWYKPLVWALENEWDVVGPVTNAPGTETAQWVGGFLLQPDAYRPSDDPAQLKKTANELWECNGNTVRQGRLNGFMMMGRTARLWEGRYDETHVFCPCNEWTSKHGRNPTPLMTLHEYESQARWEKLGWKIGFCPASYVLHYRSVTRGEQYKRGQWLRAADAK